MPHVGTWIEIGFRAFFAILYTVVPHVGSGLKSPKRDIRVLKAVVPHVGTWIEMTRRALS